MTVQQASHDTITRFRALSDDADATAALRRQFRLLLDTQPVTLSDLAAKFRAGLIVAHSETNEEINDPQLIAARHASADTQEDQLLASIYRDVCALAEREKDDRPADTLPKIAARLDGWELAERTADDLAHSAELAEDDRLLQAATAILTGLDRLLADCASEAARIPAVTADDRRAKARIADAVFASGCFDLNCTLASPVVSLFHSMTQDGLTSAA